MPAYNFKKQFEDDVEKGHKRQTIRPKRKRPTKPGDLLYLYTGMRTKTCRKLRTDFCLSVTPIVIYPHHVKLNETFVEMGSVENLAQSDGFETSTEFFRFFEKQYGFPFEGELIKW